MAGVEREGTDPRSADRDAASARWRWPVAVAIPCLLVGLTGLGAEADRPTATEPPPAAAPAPPQKSPVRAPLPATPAEQRPGASPPGPDAAAPPEPIEPPSLGPPSLEPARLAPPTEERAVVPAPTTEPSDEDEDEVEVEAQPSSAVAPPRPRTATDLARAAAGTFVPAQGAALAIQLLERTLRSLDPRKLSAADLAQRLRRAPDELPAEPGHAATPGAAAVASTAVTAVAPVPPPEESGMLDGDALDRIRLEIKARLPYFQACADAARRRGSPDVRRLQAIWSVGADGAIKDLKLENVSDAQLTLCIVRMGSRPFTVRPGADLTIPTPIVFVR
jgi:hypothetical protein